MNKKNKIVSFLILTAIIFSSSALQMHLLASTVPINDDGVSEESSNGPILSDISETIDLPGGSLDVESVGNTTNTGLNQHGATTTVTSKCDEESKSTTTVVNGTKEITNNVENSFAGTLPKTNLTDTETGFNAEISNDFGRARVDKTNDPTDLHLQADHLDMGLIDLDVNVVENQTDDFTEYIEINNNIEDWKITYDNISNAAYAELSLLMVSPTFYVRIAQHHPEPYIKLSIDGHTLYLNDTGLYDGGWASLANWTEQDSYLRTTTNIGDVIFNFTYNTLTIHCDLSFDITFTLSDLTPVNVYYISYVCAIPGRPVYITWFSGIISFYYGVFDIIQITFYLYVYNYFIYCVWWEFHAFEIKFFYFYMIIEWLWISLEIWLMEIDTDVWVVHWIMIFNWFAWNVKIQWWFNYDLNFLAYFWNFYNYYLTVQYVTLTQVYEYNIYVPTNFAPNYIILYITLETYTDTEFVINFSLYDEMWNDIDTAAITATWNDVDVEAEKIVNLGNGKYSLTLAAILVNPGDPAIEINLTMSAIGCVDTEWIYDLAVDPDAVAKSTADDDDDDANDDDDDDDDDTPAVDAISGASLLLVGAISSISTLFIAILISKKRQFARK